MSFGMVKVDDEKTFRRIEKKTSPLDRTLDWPGKSH